MITTAAHILRQETRSQDVCFRTGGDEFVVIFPALTDLGVLDRIGARMIAALEQPIPFENVECHISASIGCARCHSADHSVLGQIQKDADTALYAAKRAGRGRLAFSTGSRK